ncbi:M20/M25/M40 family metallo-hydrolase [Variovorax sp. ZT4R33]|uniref:M20/M25/M40 family metallo-hydrolase n=1 Tax=Variovorax sp. ZT4R33 TaxID=3443743 RepID=UPI003F467240
MPALLAGLCLAAAAQAQHFAPKSMASPTVRPEVRLAFARLLASPPVQRTLDAVRDDHPRAIADLRLLTEIEAPPFKEQKRAEAFLARMKALGLADARIDGEGNVLGLRKGSGKGPTLLVSAHLDTVFPAGTDVRVRERDGRLYAPGISDDTRGLAVLLSWLRVLNEQKIQTEGDLLFAASVGEEELGNLRGMKRIFAEHPEIDGMVGLEPAPDGSVLVAGTASRRHEVVFSGPGGHSFGAFGRVPSAVHGMGRAIAKIAELKTPSFPRTTFTVGTASGGTAVNVIAAEARMVIDIRSDAPAELRALERKIFGAVDAAVREENARAGTHTLRTTHRLVGERPGGRTPSDAVIVEAAVRANASAGRRTLLRGGSTDANVPMAMGIPAIVLGGGGQTGGFHALDEWIDLHEAWRGAQNSLLTVLGLVGVQEVSAPLLTKRSAAN